MPNGTIRRLVRDRGFWFITSGDGQDLFFHRSELQGVAFDSLKEGQTVEFEKSDTARGLKAVNIKLIEKAN